MRTEDAVRMVKNERRTTILSVSTVLRDVLRGGAHVRLAAYNGARKARIEPNADTASTAIAAVRTILARLYMRDGLTEVEAWKKVRKVK